MSQLANQYSLKHHNLKEFRRDNTLSHFIMTYIQKSADLQIR
jgi:hypothetical protein